MSSGERYWPDDQKEIIIEAEDRWNLTTKPFTIIDSEGHFVRLTMTDAWDIQRELRLQYNALERKQRRWAEKRIEERRKKDE